MRESDAVAGVFLTAFRTLPRKTQGSVLAGLLKDKRLRDDVIDLAIAESRAAEPTRPLRQVLAAVDRRRAA